ncbi:transketolase [Shouchella tritolerans]|uniref:transketolase n=1 Tax=Shouchella tritolerans TaxID=2979466 RepID=UPI0021E7B053|nr:transketolase [Shouchella tritolerans]
MIEQLAINTIRTLSIDSIENAQSGHPGLPMGAAPIGYQLFAKTMNHNPGNPNWFNRDRFILSAGHGSALLYSLLHLCGYDVSIEDLKHFRKLDSNTPGHPEYGHTPGVEATTGPLGQGIAMAVGMAMAERQLAETYNKENFPLIDHYTYSLCGDGDLMEGISSEAASLAGHLKLGKLIVLYDSNDISLDGELSHSFSEDVGSKFIAQGWHVEYVKDGNDLKAISEAIDRAQKDDRPSLIEVKTIIGFGSPNKSGSSASHGAPLGSEEVLLTKEAYKWTFDEDFYVPKEVQVHFSRKKNEGALLEKKWNDLFANYEAEYPELAAQLKQAIQGKLPANWYKSLPTYEIHCSEATRASSGTALNAAASQIPQLVGGSADLASSNKTNLKGQDIFNHLNYGGRNIWFGVREFAMGAALNGMALHGGLKVFGGTFFVFSDYLRPAVRLSALMKLPVIYVLTHDSIAVGEDGPTHQPVEHLASLRAMPGLSVIRPGDGNETVAAWRLALESEDTPTALVLSRQNVPVLSNTAELAYEGVKKGGYIVSEASKEAELILIATGSELPLALQAQTQLEAAGVSTQVVSMPSWDRFEQQPKAYRQSVLPPTIKSRLAIEMGSSLGWAKYIGDEGEVLSIDTFGASGNGDLIMKTYGFTVENVVNKAKALLKETETLSS